MKCKQKETITKGNRLRLPSGRAWRKLRAREYLGIWSMQFEREWDNFWVDTRMSHKWMLGLFVVGWLDGWKCFAGFREGKARSVKDFRREMLCYLGACNSKEEAFQQYFCCYRYRYCYFNISLRLKWSLTCKLVTVRRMILVFLFHWFG